MEFDEIEFRWKRATAQRWTEANTVLGPGEPGFELDTRRSKVGDGFHGWNDLAYTVGDASTSGGAGSDPRVGDLADLSTTNQTTIVAAINEMNLPDVPYLTLYNNAKAG